MIAMEFTLAPVAFEITLGEGVTLAEAAAQSTIEITGGTTSVAFAPVGILGPQGPVGPEGPKGADGAAQIPDVISGGSF